MDSAYASRCRSICSRSWPPRSPPRARIRHGSCRISAAVRFQLRHFPVMSTRRSAVALRHVAFEDLGLLAPIMEREGWDVSFCEAPLDDLTHHSIRNADLVVVLGGPIGVYETDDYPFLTSETA